MEQTRILFSVSSNKSFFKEKVFSYNFFCFPFLMNLEKFCILFWKIFKRKFFLWLRKLCSFLLNGSMRLCSHYKQIFRYGTCWFCETRVLSSIQFKFENNLEITWKRRWSRQISHSIKIIFCMKNVVHRHNFEKILFQKARTSIINLKKKFLLNYLFCKSL